MTKDAIKYWEGLLQAPIVNPTEFFTGQQDCKEGGWAGFRDGFGEDYERGFWAQYQINELRVKLL